MWVAELRVWHDGGQQLELSKKLDVAIGSYYLGFYKHGKKEYVAKVITATGSDKKKFFELFTQDKRLEHFHLEGDQLYFGAPPNKFFHNAVLDKSIFFVKPIITKKGFEYWTVASWNKQALQELVGKIRKAKPFAKAELLSLSQRRLNFFIPTIFGELTEKQRGALELAFENGYYNYPRKASVEHLARIAKVPRSTFQEHLRKAEAKVLPAVMAQLSFTTPDDTAK